MMSLHEPYRTVLYGGTIRRYGDWCYQSFFLFAPPAVCKRCSDHDGKSASKQLLWW